MSDVVTRIVEEDKTVSAAQSQDTHYGTLLIEFRDRRTGRWTQFRETMDGIYVNGMSAILLTPEQARELEDFLSAARLRRQDASR